MSLSETIRKMNEMKLFGMAHSIEERERSAERTNLTCEEFLGLLVDDEYLHRKNNRLTRLLQNAKLKIPQACFEEIDYRHPRSLVKSEIIRLQSAEWITVNSAPKRHPIPIQSATPFRSKASGYSDTKRHFFRPHRNALTPSIGIA